jgi:hypothetical protein
MADNQVVVVSNMVAADSSRVVAAHTDNMEGTVAGTPGPTMEAVALHRWEAIDTGVAVMSKQCYNCPGIPQH